MSTIVTAPVYCHDKFGVINLQNKFVIPPIYEQISKLDGEVYKCFPKYEKFSDFNTTKSKLGSKSISPRALSAAKETLSEHFRNPFFSPAELRDRNNQLIHLAVPDECSVSEVFIPQSLKQHTAEQLQRSDVLYMIAGANGSGVLDGSGKVILSPEYENPTIINDFENSGLKGITARQKTTHAVVKIKTDIASDVTPPFKPLHEGYKLVRGATENDSRDLLFRANLICKIPAPYDEFYLLDDSHLVVKTSWYKPEGKTPPPMVLDRFGNIKIRLPDNTQFVQLTDSGFIVETKTGNLRDDWKNGIDLLFVDKRGKIVSEVHCNAYHRFEHKLSIAKINNGKYGNTVGQFESDYVCQGVISDDGRWLIKPEYCQFTVASPERIIKKIYQTHFNSEECKSEDSSLITQFDLLLNEYHLIGMPKSKLNELIGTRNSRMNQDVLHRMISGFGNRCGNGHSYIDFKLENDRVKAWRVSSLNRSESKWIIRDITSAEYARLD